VGVTYGTCIVDALCEYALQRLCGATALTHLRRRNGKDIGRKVAARGFWGDIVNPPYHSFGTASEDARFFVVANKQLSHTAVDVAEFNVQVRPKLRLTAWWSGRGRISAPIGALVAYALLLICDPFARGR
jgi:hypothetical protein